MVVRARRRMEFLLRFQQFTGPVMAKGVEDTAFYCYDRLTGMNEVGAIRAEWGRAWRSFTRTSEKMQATHPRR